MSQAARKSYHILSVEELSPLAKLWVKMNWTEIYRKSYSHLPHKGRKYSKASYFVSNNPIHLNQFLNLGTSDI